MAPLAMMSSKLALTTSAVNGVPSENVTSSRRWNVNSVASALTSQDSASHGVSSPVSGSCSSSESKSWRVHVQRVVAAAAALRVEAQRVVADGELQRAAGDRLAGVVAGRRRVGGVGGRRSPPCRRWRRPTWRPSASSRRSWPARQAVTWRRGCRTSSSSPPHAARMRRRRRSGRRGRDGDGGGMGGTR